MNNLTMFCLSMNPNHLNLINEFNYVPVGLGKSNFSNAWIKDNSGENISEKNKYYGEYTFHYWLWKNHLNKVNDGWIGFCQYRKFWGIDRKALLPFSLDQLKSLVVREIPESHNNFDTILGDEASINEFKLMKFIKKGFKLIVKKPSYLFDQKKRNINFHFDLMHGYNNLNKSIELLESEDRKDFAQFVNSKTSFNPHNMFICKSKKILENYYSVVFPWLSRCEKEFGFENLRGYGMTRIYGFLAERFMSYWFQKNTKYTTMPIIFHDINKTLNHKVL